MAKYAGLGFLFHGRHCEGRNLNTAAVSGNEVNRARVEWWRSPATAAESVSNTDVIPS